MHQTWVSRSDLASLCGVSEGRIAQLIAGGILPRARARGSYDLAASVRAYIDQPPAVRPPVQFSHADRQLIGATVRVSGAGGRYPSALCGRCVL